MPNFHTLKRYSHRNAPKKLIPAIIACKCVTYLIVLGFLICLCGLIPLFIRHQINEQFVNDLESINKTVTTNNSDSNQTIVEKNDQWLDQQNSYYIFYSCLGIGCFLFVLGLICLIIAYYYYQTYEGDRIRHIQITDLDADVIQPVTDPIIDGVGYPINLLNKSKQSEYMPISQTNGVVYKSTTEPIK